MSDWKEKRVGFVDIFHCRDQTDSAKPYMEGKIKVEKTGEELFVKLWLKPQPNVTKQEKLEGYFYRLVKEGQ